MKSTDDLNKYDVLLEAYNRVVYENQNLKAILKELSSGLSIVGEKLEQLKEIKP